MIKAECHSDDRCVEVDFDATPWFEAVPDRNIIDLAVCGWGGDYPADYVAEFMADRHDGIKEMYDYIEIRNRKRGRDMMGFECHVNPEDAMQWLRENRPELSRKVCIIVAMD